LIHRQIIWVKPHFVFGRGDYHWQHELCFYGWVKGHRPKFYGERNQSTVWALDEGGGVIRKDQSHPSQKPVELFVRPIRNHTKAGEVCFEPFAGSGSQIIAAQKTARRCFAMEIEPRYVDVCVERWQNATGQKAALDGA
jgi:DNA modification methylase